MTNNTPPAPATPRHSSITRLFHWLTVLLLLVMFPVGMAMTSEGFEAYRDGLYVVHKGLGSIILVLVVLRVVWKLVHRGPPPAPSMTPLQQKLASLTHGLLLALLLVMTMSGFVRVVGGGFPMELLNWLGVPTFLPEMPRVADTMSVVHKFTAYTLVAVISAHLAAAVHQILAEGQGPSVFRRIWPPLGGRD
ncbi:MAG: cytochrome b/b6 domain-containing protein [Gemmatimonadota bacterium]